MYFLSVALGALCLMFQKDIFTRTAKFHGEILLVKCHSGMVDLLSLACHSLPWCKEWAKM